MKTLGVCYWYVKMRRCGRVEHGLEYMFYVQKHIVHLAAMFWFLAGSWLATRGAHIWETPLVGLFAACWARVMCPHEMLSVLLV